MAHITNPLYIYSVTNPLTDSKCEETMEKKCPNTYVPEPEPPLPPTGNCVILYDKCFYSGRSEVVCTAEPDIYINTKSIYVPKDMTVTLHDLEYYEGRSAEFAKSVTCLDVVDFKNKSFLEMSGITLLDKMSPRRPRH